MRFGVLGPIAVDPAKDEGLGGSRQRRLLAALLVERGHVVSVDRLADIVFEGEPSDAAAVTMRSYIARLRRSLEPTGAHIITSAPGYRLDPGTAEVDADLFENALAEAKTLRSDGQVDEALPRVVAGLELWQGAAYAEFAGEDWIRAEAIRLEELRTQAEELRLDLLLELGRHDEVVSEATALAGRQPLRERPRIQLVMALYRSGRQPDALRAASAYRDELADVGLEPTSDFDRLEDRIVMHDPDLRVPPRTGRSLRGYRIEERLGGREDAEVHVAVQPGIERLVVVTSYGPSIADDPVFIREFEPTVRRVTRLDSPGLVEVLDFWREPGSAHLVTRLARGGSLSDLLEKGPLPVDTVGRITAQVAEALVDAHAAGLSHGLLGPDDVLFDDDTVLLAKVGTAEIVDAIRDHRTLRGSPRPATDQLALAGLVHRALTAIVPTGRELSQLPRVSEVRPELLAVDAVLARAGANSPDDRYPDIGAFARSFADAVGDARPSRSARPRNPYKGLRAFSESESGDFHGRDRLSAEVLARLREHRMVAVIGPSGSGKSSVVRAGVVSRYRQEANRPLVATMVPGATPFNELTRSLRSVVPLDRGARLDAASDGVHTAIRAVDDRLILVIDQFEELYTLLADDTERVRFIDGLMDAVDDRELDLRVLLTLRADFFDQPLQHHRLGEAVSAGAVPITAMSPAELERAVVEPAHAAGVTIETPVVTELVADIVDQPAGLPLLQFALTELFESRDGTRVSMEDHDRLGGVAGAISQRAERLYGEATAAERHLIRTLFLRLVTVGVNGADIRRRADRAELLSAASERISMDHVIDRFGAARLLAFDRNPSTREPTVEVAHEALLRHWPRLRSWVDDAGRDLLIRSHLTMAATAWVDSGRDDGELYRGGRLEGVGNWLERTDLTDAERAFLQASLDRRAGEQAAERELFEREVRSNKRLRRMLTGVAITLVVALVAGFAAVGQRNRAMDETRRAEQALGRALGLAAVDRLASDRSLALLLAVEATRLDRSDQTRSAVLEALGGDDAPFTRTVIPTPADVYLALDITSDGRIAVAKRADGSVDIVDLERRDLISTGISSPAAPDLGIDVAPDDQLFVTSGVGDDGVAAVVHRVHDGSEVARIPSRIEGSIHQAVFSDDGRWIVMSDAAGVMTMHDPTTGAEVDRIDTGPDSEIINMIVSDNVVYVTADNGSFSSIVSAWDLQTGRPVADRVEVENEFLVSMTVADGMLMVAGDRIHVFDMTTLSETVAPFGDATGGASITGLAVSPDGLVAAGSATDLMLFAPDEDEHIELPVTGQTPGLAFSPDGRTLVTADPDGTISTWRVGWIEDLGEPLAPEGPGLVTVAPDGDQLAVWARGRGVQLFEAESLQHIGALEGLGREDSFLGLDFSPDGLSIVVLICPAEQEVDCDASIEVFDTASMRRSAGPVRVGPVPAHASTAVEFTGDGSQIATASSSGDVLLFDAATLEPNGRLPLADVAPAAGLRSVVVTANVQGGRSYVAALADFGQGAVWDLTGDPVAVGLIEGPANSLWFDPAGELYVGSVNGPFWTVDPGTLDRTSGVFPSDEPILRFSVSDTGILAASSGLGGTRLWDAASRLPLSGDMPSFVSDVDRDGMRLFLGAIGFDEGGVRVASLPLDIDLLVEAACRAAGRNLTLEEWRLYLPEGSEHRAVCPEWPVPTD